MTIAAMAIDSNGRLTYCRRGVVLERTDTQSSNRKRNP